MEALIGVLVEAIGALLAPLISVVSTLLAR
jgi:hypothetical protein